MRKVYAVLTGLLMISVLAQFYFAAFGVFTAPATDSQFALHQTNGRLVLPLLCLLCIAAAALARAPGRLIGITAIPLALLILQMALFVIAGLTGSTELRTNVVGQAILGLHAVIGLCFLAVSIVLFLRARRFAGSAAVSALAAETAAVPAEPPSGPAPAAPRPSRTAGRSTDRTT